MIYLVRCKTGEVFKCNNSQHKEDIMDEIGGVFATYKQEPTEEQIQDCIREYWS